MGKLTSIPKAPSAPAYVYVPAPSVSSGSGTTAGSSASGTSAESSADGTGNADESNQQAAQRVADILGARRGRIATILTSFRGFLEPAAATPARKTLLGE